jgi:hypothetical protein
MTSDEANRCGPPLAVARMPWLPKMRTEYRHISSEAPEKTVAIMYRREGDSYSQRGVGIFQGGRWVRKGGKPIEGDYLWAALVNE